MCKDIVLEKFNNLKLKLKLKENQINELNKNLYNYRILGDLSENPEYQNSKKKKHHLENELKFIEKEIDNLLMRNNIKFKQVKLKNLKNNKIIICDIDNCSNFFDLNLMNKVNYKNLNDIIEVKFYNKKLNFKIISINYE